MKQIKQTKQTGQSGHISASGQPSHEIIKIDRELNMRYSRIRLDHPSYNPPHWHESIEILYIYEGSLLSIVGDRQDTLTGNDFCIVDRNVVHATYTSEKIRYLLIQIPYIFLKQYIPDMDRTRIPYVCSNVQNPIPHQEQMAYLLNRLYLLQQKDPDSPQTGHMPDSRHAGYKLTYYSLLFPFLDILFRSYATLISEEEAIHSQKYMERLACIADYVDEHYKEPITLQLGAGLLALNPEYFSRFFKKYMGVTFMDYVYAIRLKAAAHEILNTDLTIQTIMENNGFTNPKHFNKIFFEKYGVTPSVFRKNRHKDNATEQR